MVLTSKKLPSLFQKRKFLKYHITLTLEPLSIKTTLHRLYYQHECRTFQSCHFFVNWSRFSLYLLKDLLYCRPVRILYLPERVYFTPLPKVRFSVAPVVVPPDLVVPHVPQPLPTPISVQLLRRLTTRNNVVFLFPLLTIVNLNLVPIFGWGIVSPSVLKGGPRDIIDITCVKYLVLT